MRDYSFFEGIPFKTAINTAKIPTLTIALMTSPILLKIKSMRHTVTNLTLGCQIAAPERRNPMRILFLALLAIASSGCAELHHHALGTRVHAFNVKGVEYVHCSILVDRAKPQLAHDAIEVCRDGIQPSPSSGRR